MRSAATTRYVKNGDAHIAFQVLGDGPVDIVFVQGFLSNLEVQWEEPGLAHLLTRLAGLGRLILFDKRGSGLSDRVTEMPTLETRMDDVRAVLDEVGSTRAVLIGASEGGPMSTLFAATHPQRTAGLVLYGAYAHFFSWVQTREQVEAFAAAADRDWGSGASLRAFAPGMLNDARFRAWWARFERLGASPAAVIQLVRMNCEIDIRPILPSVRVPTLVLHRRDDCRVNVGAGRHLAAHIAGARYVELSGTDHPIWVGDTDAVVDEIEAFLTGMRPAEAEHRVLATIAAIDIADAAQLAARLGDRAWSARLAGFHAMAGAELQRWRGHALPAPPDTLRAAFDGPSRAAQFAFALRDAAARDALHLRTGLHTGEIVLRNESQGLAQRIAERIAAAARPGDVLASGTVRDLSIGAPVTFAARGACALEGLAERIPLYAAAPRMPPTQATEPHPALRALSPREREILALVARGLTNPEIADALSLSDHTAKRHVANILLKLDLKSRAAAAALFGAA